MSTGPGFVKGNCTKTVYIKDMGAAGGAPAYFTTLPAGSYQLKHGVGGTWVNVAVKTNETTTVNF